MMENWYMSEDELELLQESIYNEFIYEMGED